MLAETLALVSAANSAYATVKKFTQNGKEISDMAGALGKIMTAEETLSAQGKSKSKSIWRKAFGKSGDSVEEFMALEKLNEQKRELKSMMQLYGRSGMWADYQKWCGQERIRKKREAEEKEVARMALINGGMWTLAAAVFSGLVYLMIRWAFENKGIFS